MTHQTYQVVFRGQIVGSGKGANRRSFFNDDPDGMNDARNIPQQGQENIDPEMQSEAHLQKHTQWWQDDGQQNTNDIHGLLLPSPQIGRT